MAFAKSAFAQFMASSAGRVFRIVAGLVIVGVGILVVKDLTGWLVALVGLVPLLAGIFDFCIFGPLFRGPFWGKRIRAAVH